MAGNVRDGTRRHRFDMFDGKKVEDGTGRDGKIMKIIVAWMGRDGTMGVDFSTRRDGKKKCHDGTGRYITIVTTGLDGKEKISRRDGTVYIFLLDGTGRCIHFHDGTGRYIISSTTGRDGTFLFFDGTGGALFS